MRALERLAAELGSRRAARRREAAESAEYEGAREWEAQWRQQTGAPAGAEVTSYAFTRMVRPSDPSGHALEAFDKVVANLGWAEETDKVVFAHTHQPLDCVTAPGGSVRYWNTGSWIYEPDLSSEQAYLGYLKNAWPGTVVVIDSDEPQPRLLRLREHLNPLQRVESPGG